MSLAFARGSRTRRLPRCVQTLERQRSVPEPSRASQPSAAQQAAANLDQLTDKQRELLEAVWRAPTVMEAAASLHMSRSNVYSSLRRISRKLGTRSVRELLNLVRHGDLFN